MRQDGMIALHQRLKDVPEQLSSNNSFSQWQEPHPLRSTYAEAVRTYNCRCSICLRAMIISADVTCVSRGFFNSEVDDNLDVQSLQCMPKSKVLLRSNRLGGHLTSYDHDDHP